MESVLLKLIICKTKIDTSNCTNYTDVTDIIQLEFYYY